MVSANAHTLVSALSATGIRGFSYVSSAYSSLFGTFRVSLHFAQPNHRSLDVCYLLPSYFSYRDMFTEVVGFRLVHRTHLSFLLVCIVLWLSIFVNSFYEFFLRFLREKPCGLKAARRKHANTPCQCKKNRLSLYKKALKQNFPALKAGKSIKIRFSRGHAHREKHLWSPPVWPWVAL